MKIIKKETIEKAIELRKKRRNMNNIAKEVGVGKNKLRDIFREYFPEYLLYYPTKSDKKLRKDIFIEKKKKLIKEIKDIYNLNEIDNKKACALYSCKDTVSYIDQLTDKFSFLNNSILKEWVRKVEKILFEAGLYTTKGAKIAIAIKLASIGITTKKQAFSYVKSIGLSTSENSYNRAMRVVKAQSKKTFEEIALDKLKELEPTTRKEWSKALGYKTPNAFYSVLMRLVRENKVIENKNIRPYKYKVK